MRPAQHIFAGLLAVMALTACRGETSDKPPVAILRNMYNQPRYNAQAESAYYQDHRTMRAPVAGTMHHVPKSDVVLTTSMVREGRTEDGSGYVDAIPAVVVERMGGPEGLLQRGADRYGIYCTPCHGNTGAGEGMVAKRSDSPAFKPPSLHTAKARQLPDGQVFAIISNGNSNMPAYRAQIPVQDRWAIVSYLRGLQVGMLNKTGKSQ